MSNKYTPVALSDISVMCIIAEGGVDGAHEAFNRLESKLPGLKKRKFFGALNGSAQTGIYRACVELMEGENPVSLGIEEWTIPGGNYLRGKIRDWEQHLDQIQLIFDDMAESHSLDEERPTVEYYRSQRELLVYFPTK